ncbi:nitroreductase family protein [Pelosinus fermentans]|uniref:Nitroreductase n=1 Tax=Pelosinus fermentans JBW45 TaxID=1192197 RepID=I9NJN8_9FIRM|nr:nitroreductase family protein [Pelosinus fermentans]AJQ25607.1 nitroreductase [Pelosinus fermentans JBW45]
MTMDFIQVDQDKCTRCGICAAVCPGIISMGAHGPQAIRNLCVSCGQCVAACPQGALDNRNAPLANQVVPKRTIDMDEETAAYFLSSRRSIRNYLERPVPRSELKKILNIARLAPSACNSQGVAYHVVDHPDTLRQITAAVINWTESELNRPSEMAASKYARNTSMMVDIYRRNGEDVVLRSAPSLIIAIADKESYASARDNTYIAFAYTQLFATAIGLGTCWAGLFEYCAASGYEPILTLLNLPPDKIVTSAMMVGYPQYTYQRLVGRNPLQVTWQ